MYKLYVNEERTIKVEINKEKDQRVWVATREHTADIWGPPVPCDEEGIRPYQASTMDV